MPVKLENGAIARSITVLCMGTAGLLWVLQAYPLTGLLRTDVQASVSPFARTERANSPRSHSESAPVSEATLNAKLVVSLGDRQVVLYQKEQRVASYPVAIGQDGWETPTGSFKVLDMERNPIWIHPITGVAVPAGADNPLGIAWIGFWTNGETEIGFHGTNEEALIGQAVSHGCLRMRNADIAAVYKQVAAGTPIVVQP